MHTAKLRDDIRAHATILKVRGPKKRRIVQISVTRSATMVGAGRPENFYNSKYLKRLK